jgi:MFS family permease
VIGDSNFLKLWSAQFTSQIGLNAIYFILTLKIYEVTLSNTAVSILILTFTVPSIFLGYIAGVYVDQLSLKKVMVITNLTRALAVFLLLIFLEQTVLLFLLVFVLAVATLFFIPAEGSAIPALVSENKLIAANSLFSLTLQTSLVIGFLIGGFGLSFLGKEESTIIAILALFILSLIFNFLLPKNIRSEAEVNSDEHPILKRFVQGIVFVFTTKKVRDSIFFLTLTTTVVFVLLTIGPGYVDRVLGQDIKTVGILVVLAATLGMGVGSLVLSNVGHRFNERVLINLGLFGLGFTFLFLATISSTQLSSADKVIGIILVFLVGLENALITIPTTTELQKHTPENLRGRAYGLLGTFVSGVAALPVLVSGAIGDLFGVRTVLVVLGILVVSFGIYRLRPRRSI